MSRAFMRTMGSPTDLAERVDGGASIVAFETLFRDERQALFAALWLVTRDRYEAEEIVQEAFVRLLERWDRVSALDDPAGYLYRTAMNVWRSRRRRAALVLRRVVHAVSADDGIAELEDRDTAVRALAALTPRERAAVVLVDLLDLTSERAGEALGIRASTVRVLLARGRRTLREGMER